MYVPCKLQELKLLQTQASQIRQRRRRLQNTPLTFLAFESRVRVLLSAAKLRKEVHLATEINNPSFPDRLRSAYFADI